MTSSNFIISAIERDLKTKRFKDIALRFPPEPNGYLHLGHAKSIVLNKNLAKRFGGTVNLRFDDTNPAKESTEFVSAIIHDSKWLGLEPTHILYASDYFPVMFTCAEHLISKGLAYVDLTPATDFKSLKGNYNLPDTASKYRTTSVEENKALFKSMCIGEFAPGSAVLRAKIDLSSANMTLRDPVLYRVVSEAHYRHHNTYKAYPMYDFAHPIEDAFEKISHSLCTLEFENNRPLYDWVIDNCVEVLAHKPRQIEFARLNLFDVALSKRHLAKLVEYPLIGSWDHPTLPTVAGLRARGFIASDIESYIEELGVAKENSTTSFKKLESKLTKKEKIKLLGFVDKIEVVISGDYIKSAELFGKTYEVSSNLAIDKKDIKTFNDAGKGLSEAGEIFRLNHLDNFKVLNFDLENSKIYVELIKEELAVLPELKLSWGLTTFEKIAVLPSTTALHEIFEKNAEEIKESLSSTWVYLPLSSAALPAGSVIEIPRLGVLLKNEKDSYSWLSRVGVKS